MDGLARSAVAPVLLVGFCLCTPLAASPRSSAPEEQQNETAPRDVEALRLAAEQGDAGAQLNLGLMYDAGEGVIADRAEALRWYRLAADQGNAGAQTMLGAWARS